MLRAEITFTPHILQFTCPVSALHPPRLLTKSQDKAMYEPSISVFKSGYRVFVHVKIDR
jgi:hypothetical protein